jgi:hypothetical protein
VRPWECNPTAAIGRLDPEPSMTHKRHEFTLGIDLGGRSCHFAVVTGIGGEEDIRLVETCVVGTTEGAFAAWFEEREPMLIVIEEGSHARWIAGMLEARETGLCRRARSLSITCAAP